MKRGGMIPNKGEAEFLLISYNRFYDLFGEIMTDSYWEKDDWHRFSKVKECFSVYTELLDYLPIKWTIAYYKKIFPKEQAELAHDFFKFIRNLLIHYSFFDRWDDVYITKSLANWSKSGQIDKFLESYKGRPKLKFRIWQAGSKEMIYLSINFPKTYSGKDKLFLKNILTEKDGVKFSLILMKRVLDSQVVSSEE